MGKYIHTFKYIYAHVLLPTPQIYVEVPRARLTMELAKIKESQGEIADAANILQELQVGCLL